MSENQESQEDELLALASIYDESSFVVSSPGEEGEQAGGQFSALLDLPQPFHVLFTAQDKDEIKQHTVQYLPPVTLNFLLPEEYPSHQPPSFILSCKWLPRDQLSLLCKKLDSIWEENQGEVILFLWTSFLKDDVCDFLGITSPLDLSHVVVRHHGPYYSAHSSDPHRGHSEAGHVGNRDESHNPNKDAVSASAAGDVSSLIDASCAGAMTDTPICSQGAAAALPVAPDPRAIQDIASQRLLLPAVLEYDRQQKEKLFNRTLFTCGVCFVEKLGSVCFAFSGCGHVYCRECMAGYFEVQIQEGNVKCLTCPSDNCDSQAHPMQVKELVDEEMFGRYDRLLLQSSLDTMSDLVYCPRTLCRSAVLQDQESGMGRCPTCHFVFCVYCKLVYHGVSPCRVKEDDVRILRESYNSGTEEDKRALERRYGRRAIKQIIEDSYTNEWLEEYSKQCPHCKAHIQKIDGCNKMTCTKCQAYFCWLCEKIISRNNPYAHFNNPVSDCYNKLFQGVVINEDDFHQFELEEEEDDDPDDFVLFV